MEGTGFSGFESEDGREMYPVLDRFFHAYLTERDVEKTLSLVSENIYSLGTGEEEVAVDKEGFERLLRMEMSVIPGPIRYRIMDYTEKQVREGLWQCFCRMETAVAQGLEEPVFYMTRLTAVFREEEGRYLAESLHMSEASRNQEGEEFFPLRFISGQAAKLQAEAQRGLLDILCGIMPGGIIGGYIEEGFPLYVVNDTMLDMMGYTYEEFVEDVAGMVINTIHEDDRERVTRDVFRRMEAGKDYAIEYRVRRKDGSSFWVYDVGRKITAADGRSAIISVLLDISGDVQRRKKLEEESETDFLTGVYNRKGGETLITRRLEKAVPYVFFMMDLDNFKQVNDVYGHDEGDNMLHFVGQLLKKSFRQTDIVTRVGGDEFAVLACPCGDVDAVRKKADLIIREYAAEAEAKCPRSRTSISVGGIYGSAPRDFQELYRLADEVLYEVKQKGKGQCRIHRHDAE